MNKKVVTIVVLIIISIISIIICRYLITEQNVKLIVENQDDIFGKYYDVATNKVKTLTLEQKIGQMLMVAYNSKDISNSYGGIIFFEKDFNGKTEEQVKTMISSLKNTSEIPFLTAVDEEGKGVIRVSSNNLLTSSNSYLKGEQFPNSQTLYQIGGFDLIKTDTIAKSKFLYQLGLNLNLAPVADMCKPGDYMYNRSVGLDADGTSNYVKTVIKASKEAKNKGDEVSYCLKHFPGYGNNKDTHVGFSVDERTLEEVIRDMASFEAGIKEEAECVLIAHNIVSSIDENEPASLSLDVHSILREELDFTGIIITDALNMSALDSNYIKGNKYVKAVLAGNDMLIVTEPKIAINAIKTAVDDETINEEIIDEAVTRIIAWKYYKNML